MIPNKTYLLTYPGHCMLTPTLYSWQIVWLVTKTFEKSKYLRNNYFAKLLWFYNCSTEDFNTSETQVWVGSRYPDHAILTSTLYSWEIVWLVTKTFEKNKYLRNNYFAKLLWFYNCSIGYFKTSEAQVWVRVKIPRPRYLDPHSVFLTDCAISYQDRLKKANI